MICEKPTLTLMKIFLGSIVRVRCKSLRTRLIRLLHPNTECSMSARNLSCRYAGVQLHYVIEIL